MPKGTPGFQVDLVADPSDSNLDLFIRRDTPVEFGPQVIADASSAGPAGLETIAVPRSKAVAGKYYIAVASRAAKP